MPNYCDNYLQIDGPADAVKTVIDFVKSSENKFDLCLSSFQVFIFFS